MQLINIDRFSGEAKEPPEWGRCAYCGGVICEGGQYFSHEGTVICTDCAKGYAYALFESEAKVKTACCLPDGEHGRGKGAEYD